MEHARRTFKLFPGLPRITLLTSSPFFLGGILANVTGVVCNKETRTCRDVCVGSDDSAALTVNTDKQRGMH